MKLFGKADMFVVWCKLLFAALVAMVVTQHVIHLKGTRVENGVSISISVRQPIMSAQRGSRCIQNMARADAASYLTTSISICPTSTKKHVNSFSELAGYAQHNVPFVSRRTRTIFCWIPKNTCTKIKMLLRRIEGYPNWQNVYAAHTTPPFSNWSQLYQDLSPQELGGFYSSKHWKRVVLLRDPVERVVSAYMDKAVGEGWFKAARAHKVPYNASRADFGLFVDASSQWMKNDHFGPQHRFCGIERLGLDAYNIVAVYRKDTIASTALQILKLLGQAHAYWGWPKHGEAGEASMFEARTPHASKVASPEQRLLTRWSCERLVQLFQLDYQVLPLVPPDCSQFSDE